jgi:hypothetical protein
VKVEEKLTPADTPLEEVTRFGVVIDSAADVAHELTVRVV